MVRLEDAELRGLGCTGEAVGHDARPLYFLKRITPVRQGVRGKRKKVLLTGLDREKNIRYALVFRISKRGGEIDNSCEGEKKKKLQYSPKIQCTTLCSVGGGTEVYRLRSKKGKLNEKDTPPKTVGDCASIFSLWPQ